MNVLNDSLSLVISRAPTWATSSTKLHAAEIRLEVIQHSDHLLRHCVLLQLPTVVHVPAWCAFRPILPEVFGRPANNSFPPFPPIWEGLGAGFRIGLVCGWIDVIGAKGCLGTRLFQDTALCSDAYIRAVVAVSRVCWVGNCIRRSDRDIVRRGAGLGVGGLMYQCQSKNSGACNMISAT